MKKLPKDDIQQSDYQPSELSAVSGRTAYLFLAGLAIGAASAYFLDPARGKRRRHVLRDQIMAQARDLGEAVAALTHDTGNRFFGLYRRFNYPPSPDVNDDTIAQRVRSEFGRKIRHARSIQTVVSNGVVTLAGPILADEVRAVLRCVRRVPGVRDIINQLDIRTEADGISGLQGEGPKYLQ